MFRPRFLWILLLVTLLPFLRRPWFFDDPSVIVTSQAAAAHPLDPYTYRLDLRYPDEWNWAPGRLPSYTHPTLSAWSIGAVMRVAGEREWPLHALFFGLAILILWILRPLAEGFTAEFGVALFWLAFSPVFFLTTLTLYPHFFYFLFYSATLLCAWKLRETNSFVWGAGLGVSLTLAALSLHQWPILVALLALFFAVEFFQSPSPSPPLRLGGPAYDSVAGMGEGWDGGVHRQHLPPTYFWSRLLGAILFVLFYGAWSAWETHLYGMPHFLATLRVRATGTHYAWQAAFLPLVFLTGGVPVMAIGWRVIAARSKWITGLLGVAMIGMWQFLEGPRGGFLWHQALLLSFLFVTGLAFLAALPYVFKEGKRTDRWLIAWFFVEFIFIQKFLTYPSGHHLLELAVPTVFLAVRMLELFPIRTAWLRTGSLALVVLTFSLAWADQSMALIGPQLARDLSTVPQKGYYWGNSFSGFSYYLKRAGWRPYDSRVLLKSDDLLVVPTNLNVSGPLEFPPGQKLVRVGQRFYLTGSILRTFSIGDSAGWYSASWGALPYSFSRAPAEIFTFYRGADPAATASQ